jgi:hypothetical protein
MREIGGTGCRFLIGERMQCGAPRRPGSSYCPGHHALCYLVPGSPAYAARLREDARDIAMSRANRIEPDRTSSVLTFPFSQPDRAA